MLIALFAASIGKKGWRGGCKAHKSLEMSNVSSEAFKPNEVKVSQGQSLASYPGQRAKVSVQTWVLVSARLRRAWSFKGEGRSLGNSRGSVIVIGSPGDGVGYFLVVHLQHVILIFDCSGRGGKKRGQ